MRTRAQVASTVDIQMLVARDDSVKISSLCENIKAERKQWRYLKRKMSGSNRTENMKASGTKIIIRSCFFVINFKNEVQYTVSCTEQYIKQHIGMTERNLSTLFAIDTVP